MKREKNRSGDELGRERGERGGRRQMPAPHERQLPPPQQQGMKGGGEGELIYGRHAVFAALGNPNRRVLAVYATQNALMEFERPAARHHVPLSVLASPELNAMLPEGAVHQGIAARVVALPELTLQDLHLDRPVIVLDQVTDPHNVGAILRSAAVFDAAAVIMTRRNSPPLTGAVAKSACGGLEHVHVIFVTNLAQALRELGDMGFFRVGLAAEGSATLEECPLAHPVALVLGAEDKGLRRLTREQCDLLARISTNGPLNSLNVSNATAVALHTVTQRRLRK
jgi:23S rRNA (guanosine2251-2'-O)-methyltransferase